MARERLWPVYCPIAIGAFDSAERGSALKHHIGALFTADKRCHPLAVCVAHVGTLLGQRRQTFRPQVGFDGMSNAVEYFELVVTQWSPRVPLHTASTLALAEVAHKGVRKNFI